MNIFTAGESAPWRLLHMTSRCSQGRRLFWISSMSDSSHLSRNWEQGYGDKKKRVPDDIRKQSPLSGVNPLLDIIFWKTKIFTSLRLCDQIPAGPDCSDPTLLKQEKLFCPQWLFWTMSVFTPQRQLVWSGQICVQLQRLSHITAEIFQCTLNFHEPEN